MGKRKTKKRKKHDADTNRLALSFLDYYNAAFLYFHSELDHKNIGEFPLVRTLFWQCIVPGVYPRECGREIVNLYRATVEAELAAILSKHSVAYWLHVYRRTSPGPIGPNTDPVTVGLVRRTLESAVHKYAREEWCEGISWSHEVPFEAVLNGFLAEHNFDVFRSIFKKLPRLVLTKFGVAELEELYRAEKLAYELWRCGATLRTLGKGARLVVAKLDFYDDRDDELTFLIRSYDSRTGVLEASATGTAFEKQERGQKAKTLAILIARYNFEGLKWSEFNKLFSLWKLGVPPEGQPNFIWMPFDLEHFFESHLPFASAFEKKHGISMSSVFGAILALCFRAVRIWTELPERTYHYWQRGYEGPVLLEEVTEELSAVLPEAVSLFAPDDKKHSDIQKVLAFLTVTPEKRKLIDVVTGGPYGALVPAGQERVFIDYAWLTWVFYHLFHGVELKEQHFKGPLLERIVHRGKSLLPTAECEAKDGTKHQIDAAFPVSDTLVIVECKAVGRSVAMEIGDRKAITFRAKQIERALSQVDQKATWIAARPEGKNYNIRGFSQILPLAVTPFVEFIHSGEAQYWISTDIPRVLTPSELRGYLSDGTFASLVNSANNLIRILS